MGFSKAGKTDVLNHIFGKTTFVPYANLYVGVSSTEPDYLGGNITEPIDPVYDRISTILGDWSSATDENSPRIQNVTAMEFLTASEDWLVGVPVSYVILFTSPTLDEYLAYGELSQPKIIYSADQLLFEPERINLSFIG